MDERQLDRMREVVEQKKKRSKAASEAAGESQPASGSEVSGDQPDLESSARPQDTSSVRAKNAGKGKKTADKWNQ
ncbi:MAG TPA: hypothetical protein VGV10_06885 [Thermoleophilaceae bacterium]|nr:hypothetical protein [Thermoleophilaceae bacterium]